MHSFDVSYWFHQLLAPSNGVVLWISLALLLLALAFWAQRRSAIARARAERARREAEREELGGDSFFMPLPAIEQAVEIANPVEIDSLLNGESETVAARARDLLTAPTGVCTSDGVGDLPSGFGVPLEGDTGQAQPNLPATARPGAAAAITGLKRPPVLPVDVPPTIAITFPGSASKPPAALAVPVPATLAQRTPAPVALPLAPATPATPATSATGDQSGRIPVRDLVLTWFEARGYRASAVSVQFRPIELELRHRTDPDRNYAFVVERERVTGSRASALLHLARAAGHSRVLVAAESGSDEVVTRDLRRRGIRVFEQSSIRAELEKVDIRIAAKIIAVARGRIEARQSKPPAPVRAVARQTEAPVRV
jgi:hypothetical protein